ETAGRIESVPLEELAEMLLLAFRRAVDGLEAVGDAARPGDALDLVLRGGRDREERQFGPPFFQELLGAGHERAAQDALPDELREAPVEFGHLLVAERLPEELGEEVAELVVAGHAG